MSNIGHTTTQHHNGKRAAFSAETSAHQIGHHQPTPSPARAQRVPKRCAGATRATRNIKLPGLNPKQKIIQKGGGK